MAFHYRRLGQNMRRIRLSANMTQRTVAEALGYRSCEHWSRIESGVRHIPLHILDSFCKVTGASYAEVLLGTTDAQCSQAHHWICDRTMKSNFPRSLPPARMKPLNAFWKYAGKPFV